jgi:hypothetical protein
MGSQRRIVGRSYRPQFTEKHDPRSRSQKHSSIIHFKERVSKMDSEEIVAGRSYRQQLPKTEKEIIRKAIALAV